MKRSNTVLMLFVFAVIVGCSPGVVKKDANIRFEINEFDFGELNYKTEGHYSFKFVNTGNTPLVIQNVSTSCGCTIPEWSNKPIKPGKKGEIRINYDTSNPGRFNKTITVFYNGSDSPYKLIVKGSVKHP